MKNIVYRNYKDKKNVCKQDMYNKNWVEFRKKQFAEVHKLKKVCRGKVFIPSLLQEIMSRPLETDR